MFGFAAFRAIVAATILSAVPMLAGTPDEFFRAIRANDMAGLRHLAAERASVNVPDARGTTPLHYAAVTGSDQALQVLLDAGADVNKANAIGATPLVLGAWSAARVRMLLAAGADPNAATKAGRTALIVAAGRAGGFDAVRALLAAGARLDAADQTGATALQTASSTGDLQTVRLLLEKGAAVNAADKAGFTPLLGAVMRNDIERVRLLLGKGADPNAANTFAGKVRHGDIALKQLTPLMVASPHGSVDMVRTILAAGGKVDARDSRGMTALMLAVASENQDPNIIRALLAAGADPNAKDMYGQSVTDWARKAGYPKGLALLARAGAASRPEPAVSPAAMAGIARLVPAAGSNKGDAPAAQPNKATAATLRMVVEEGAALLHRSTSEFFRQSGCMGCHHQPVAAQAVGKATAAGLPVHSLKDELVKGMNATRPVEPALLQFIDPGGEVDSVGNAVIGFAAAGISANSLTDAAMNYIAGKQNLDGSWTMFGISRPPFEESTITRTALAVRALRLYGWPARQAEFDERTARARAWLLKAEPRTSYERADLLLGLHWAGARPSELARVAAGLMREQRPDGGWAQNRHLAADAYATGLALHALHESGQLRADDPRYRRGVDFLLRTRSADGSWYVASRAPKFQPYFESGFPHGHDQWISATATAYAVMALAPATEAPGPQRSTGSSAVRASR